MKYTFTRKQIVNAFNNKILDDDNFLTYLLSTTSKDIPMNQKSLNKQKPKELEWDRFVKENHTNFSKDANGIKYEFYEDDLLEFITQQRTELLEEIKDLQTYVLFNDTEKLISLEEVINIINKKYE